jgi:hypothetical protein
VHRLDEGRPLRQAMKAAGLSIADVVELTKKADPTGYGVKKSTIGHLITTGRSARPSCDDRASYLIAEALGSPVENFFALPSP